MFSYQGGQDMDLMIRNMTKTRQPWQIRGITIFESLGYVLCRFGFIFVSFILAQGNDLLISLNDSVGNYSPTWVFFCMLINFVLLIDLVLHLVFYGWRPILALRKEFVWEAILQAAF